MRFYGTMTLFLYATGSAMAQGLSLPSVHQHMRIKGGNIHHGAMPLLQHCLGGMLHGEHHTFKAEIDGEVSIGLCLARDLGVLLGACDLEACINGAKAFDRC